MTNTIYFICTGNSCRSQMAEAFAKEILGNEWQAYSAGIEAHGINEDAVTVMNEVGIDISQQTSNIIDREILETADLVVTLCSDADNNCPVLPMNTKKEHWGFDDPAGLPLSEFRRVRDEIKSKIEAFNMQ